MDFLFYLIQVNLYLIIFYAFYRAVLFGETFHQLNRVYLVASALLSFGIPLWYSEYVQSWFITQEINAVFYTLYNPDMALIRPAAGFNLTWADFMNSVYIGGISIFSVRLLITLLQLVVVLKRKNFEKFSAFSFFGYSFVDETLKKRDTILAHEHVHIQQLHSADVMIFEVIAILNWFNPVVYLYKRDVKHIHEFIADEIASRNEPTKAEYAMLLFSQEFGLQPHQLANSFFRHSTLRRRIEMLNKPRSRNLMLLKYGLSVPLFILMLVVSSAMIVRNDVFAAVGNSFNRITENKVGFLASADKQLSRKYSDVIDSRVIMGRITSADNGDPLPGVSIQIAGKERGTTTDVNGNFKMVVSDTDHLIISFVGMEIVEVVVGEQTEINLALKMKNVRVGQLQIRGNKDEIPGNVGNEEKVFDSVDEHPEYPGGINEMFRFIGNNLAYPTEAHKNNVSGKVFAQFVVKKDGSISNVRILKGIGFGCDEETMRVLYHMPKWKPGKKDGVAVNVKFTVPVNFMLEEAKFQTKPLAKTEIRLRGLDNKSELLVMVDGKETQGDVLAKVNPQNIESVQIIKDQLALNSYGEKGRNGVILIRTKPDVKK